MKKVLFIIILFIGIIYFYLNSLTQLFGYSPSSFLSVFIEAKSLSNMRLSRFQKPTFLILGLDPRNDVLEKTEVTDTIILAQLNLEKNILSIVSLPRDTWSEKHKQKINKLYPQSQKTSDPNKYLRTEFSEITGQNINHVFVITTQTFKQISSLVGPVSIDLPYGFVDDRYPNPDYIATPSASIPIYKTVSFQKGENIISEKNVLEFVRSRKGSDIPSQGGTDLGRIGRQHLLIEAYLKALKSSRSITLLAEFFKLYKTISKDLTDPEALLYLLSINNLQSLQLNTLELPINTPGDVIYDPEVLIENQSVLLARNNFYDLQIFLAKTLP